jgi:DNA-binding transcriptional MerR regulator
MSKNRSQTVEITVAVAARQTRLSTRAVRRFIRCGVVGRPLTEDDLAELRRARRLAELGVNLAGVEMILRMRRRVDALQARMAALGVDIRPFSQLPEMPEAWMLISPDEGKEESENG